MGKHKWVPDRAEYFTCHREPGSDSLTIMFYKNYPDLGEAAVELHLIEELHDVLTNDDNHRLRESVLQQIRERKDPRVESRIDIIGQNGNDGLHYDAVKMKPGPIVCEPKESFTRIKQPHYQDATGDDWIDESYRTMTWEQFCGAMKFTIGKYLRRLGKKDDEVQEIEKVADYSERWLQKAKLRIREKV